MAPPEDYWSRVAALCERYGILLIADEVMTGFGRTGRWFGLDHWGVTADLVIGAKGVTSGYWPFGLVAASRSVAETITDAGPFVHGFTYSHSPVGAAVAGEVLRILEEERLVEASARMGDRLRRGLQAALEGHPSVGEIRGRGMLIGIELVEDLGNRNPFPRAERVTEKVLAAAREAGVLLYSSTGHADGVDGDLVVLGPPFVLTDAEAEKVVDLTAAAVRDVTRRD
jgi:hypothetical protein